MKEKKAQKFVLHVNEENHWAVKKFAVDNKILLRDAANIVVAEFMKRYKENYSPCPE